MPKAGSSGDSADDVVLTGMSGRLPESATIEEFSKQLFAGVDLVTGDGRRWTPGLHGLPERNGKLKDLVHFDATFFGVHAKQAHVMDPMIRMLLEVTHEALIDAGINPAELRGSRTAVYVGVSKAETYWKRASGNPDKISGYEIIGGSSTMFANRISYTFDFKGPSFVIDAGCASSLFALTYAMNDIRYGLCDTAIVAASNLCLNPTSSLNFHRLSMLSPEGRCAVFDASANGYVRSEAVVAVLLQRRGAARRVYATMRGAGVNNDGRKEEGITFPSGDMQRKLAQETFQSAGLRPQDVVYFEAHGTGTKVGDPNEVNAIAELFCKDRQKSLLIGSVKSNIGHTESAAGLCSIVKILIAMQSGVIPSNLHFQSPNPDIPALRDGRLQVVSRNTEWDGGLVAINSFGFGGTNALVILESDDSRAAKGQAGQAPGEAKLPRLVLASGRTKEAVRTLLQHAQANHESTALHALLDAVHALPIQGHEHRGYRLLVSSPQEEVLEMKSGSGVDVRPVWFVFSGMGSQWPGMARSLLALPVFAASIERSSQVLRPHGIDLLHVLTEANEKTFDNVINSFVSIVAVQVALVDVLREVGINPDGIVGTSVGEIGCAYADEALTAEQAVLCAYWRGRCVLNAKLPPGAMVAVGLSWEEAHQRCPPDVELACHNTKNNVTIAGPAKSIEKFHADLAAKGIFARGVHSCGVAFHSKNIAGAAPLLRKSLEKVIPLPKPRSARWVTSSLPEEQWSSELAKQCSAEYFVNNLVSPVRLARALEQVPAHALVLEVAPHALLSPLLRRSLPHATHVPLVHRHAADPAQHLLVALGKLFVAGCQPRVGRLYPPVPWPVPRGTPFLASHVRWDHSIEWNVVDCSTPQQSAENFIEFDLSCAEHAFFLGHNIDGRIVFPVTGYLTMVWHVIAKLHNKTLDETCVALENVEFLGTTIMTHEAPVRFLVTILVGSGEFEVYEGGKVVASGTVRLLAERATKPLAPVDLPAPPAPADAKLLPLDSNDIYKELCLRGYNYSGVYCGIRDFHGNAGQIAWHNNWISFLDTMLQFNVIGMDTRDLLLCTRLHRVVIDPIAQTVALVKTDGTLPVKMDRDIGMVVSGGIEIQGIKMSLVPRHLNPQPTPKLKKYEFVPYDNANVSTEDISQSKRDALTVNLQLVLENVGSLKLKIMEVALEHEPKALLLPLVMQLLDDEPLVQVEAVLFASGANPASLASLQELGVKVTNKDVRSGGTETDCHVVLAADVVLQGLGALPALAGALAARGALLLHEPLRALDARDAAAAVANAGLRVLSRQAVAGSEFILLGRRETLPAARTVLEVTGDSEFAWLPRLQVAMQRAAAEDSRLFVWSRERDSGILGLAACLRREAGGRALRTYYLPGACADFSPDAQEYAAQVHKDLAVNVLRAGAWGCYRHLPLAAQDAASLAQVEHAYVSTVTRGDLSSLRWIESELKHAAERPLPAGTALCRVHYAPLNLRDVLLATGELAPDAPPSQPAARDGILGLEFSGRSSRGQRVMGMVAAGGLATSVLCKEAFLWHVPDAWSLEQAATVPVAYATAYFALAVRGRVRRGESVLVHRGAGGVGQAAIAIALHAGCTVFTTVGSPAKRTFLLARFPALRPEHVGNSRDTSFEQLVMQRTRGRGADLVLNSLTQERQLASMRCLAEGGRFMELGKLDLSKNVPLGTNTTLHSIQLHALFNTAGDDADRAAVVHCVSEGITSGAVRPLPSTVFSTRQIKEAFRYMAAGDYVGKVVLRVREEDCATAVPVCAVPRTYMRANKSYVLVGGLGGFGLELASWLVARGARCLVLVSRSGVHSGYQARCVRRWQQAGVHVLLSAVDASTPEGARRLLRGAHELAPVAGLFNLAAELRDHLLENQTEVDFRAVVKPKMDITRALDVASRELAPELEYFVVFSSMVTGRGNPGQSNFGLANSAVERIMEQRRADGLLGLAIQWGPVGEVDQVVAMRNNGREVDICGSVPQSMASCLGTLEALLASPHAVVGSLVLAGKRRRFMPATKDIVQSVANILGIKDPSKVSQTMSMADLGMDSLICFEIQQTLERDYNLVLDVQEIRPLTFTRLLQLAGGDGSGHGNTTAKAGRTMRGE